MRGSTKKRGSTWYVIYDIGRDPVTNKRIQKKKGGFQTKKAAEKFLAEQIHTLETGLYMQPSDMSFGEYLDYWIENYAKTNVAPRTFEVYCYMIKTHIQPTLGKIQLAKLLPLHLQNYYTQMMKEGRKDGEDGGLSAQSVRHHHRLISKALTDAVKWQFVPRNVAEAVTSPKPKKIEMETLNAEQVAKLLDVARESKYFSIIFAAIHTGMRRGELLALRWQDLDFENKIIHVRQSMQPIKGEGLSIKEPKSGKSRTITMTESLIQVLKETKKEQDKTKRLLGEEYQDYDFVFAQSSGKPFYPSELLKAYNKIIKKAGVPSVRFHDLRHTHATLMLRQGIHPKIVSERLGHSTIGITLDTYTHVLPNLQREATEQFERLFMDNETEGKNKRVTNL